MRKIIRYEVQYCHCVFPQVGRVLGAVEDAGLAESTVVMFVGDHGYQVGYQGTRVLVIIIIIPGGGTRVPGTQS